MSTHHPSGHQADDAYTPHELGLLMGNRWAEMVRQAGAIYDDGFGRRIDPVRAAAQEEPQIAKEVRRWLMEDCGVREHLDASADPDAESAFWGGFRGGVRAYIVETRIGGDN